MAKSTLAGSTLPSRFSNPEPLSLCTVPVTLKLDPEVGLAVMASMSSTVVERTVTVLRLARSESRSKLPL